MILQDLGPTTVKLVPNFGSISVENSNSESRDDFSGKEKDLLLISNNKMEYLCSSDPKCLLNLQNITLSRCGKLTALFSVSALRSLPQLNELIIIECEELEKITIQDEENENMLNPCSQKICFPQLKVLAIRHCNKLKHLFSISTSRKFPKLKCLIIYEASQLQEVFENEKCETEESKELVFPELKYLILMQLPSLTNASQEIEFQTVTSRVVQNCPNLSLATTLQKPVYQLTCEINGMHY